MPQGIEGGLRPEEVETGSTGEFANEVLATLKAKERGSAFSDIESQTWGDLESNFSQQLEAVSSPDLEQARKAWSEVPAVIANRNLSDPERVGAWLAMCDADIKVARTLAGEKPSGPLPEHVDEYLRGASPRFNAKEVQVGNVSVYLRNLGDARPSAVNMILEALEVNQDRDGLASGDPEFETLLGHLQEHGINVKHYRSGVDDQDKLYKTSVPGFILEVSPRDKLQQTYRKHDLRWVRGHYLFPERFEQAKEQMKKS